MGSVDSGILLRQRMEGILHRTFLGLGLALVGVGLALVGVGLTLVGVGLALVGVGLALVGVELALVGLTVRRGANSADGCE